MHIVRSISDHQRHCSPCRARDRPLPMTASGLVGEKCDKSGNPALTHNMQGERALLSATNATAPIRHATPKGKKIENCGIKIDWVNCVCADSAAEEKVSPAA